MVADRSVEENPAKRMKLTNAPAPGMSIKQQPADGIIDLEIVFVKNEVVIKPKATWLHRFAIAEAEKAEKEEKLDEIKRAREDEEQRIAELAARTRLIEKMEETVRAKRDRQERLVFKLQLVFGEDNVIGRLGDLFTYSDIKYREALEHFRECHGQDIVVATPEVEASCRKYMSAKRYADEQFRILSQNTSRPRNNLRSLASETVKLADDVYRVFHKDAATRAVLWRLICRLNYGIAFCKNDQEAARLSARFLHPRVWATITWAGVWRKGEYRREEYAEKPGPTSAIAIEEARVEKLVFEKPRLKEELAKLKEQSATTTFALKDAEKEVDRLDYMIVVKKEYCAANASPYVLIE